MGKNIGILLLSIAVILSAATFLTTQTLDKSTNDAGFLLGHMTLKVIDENGVVKAYRQTDNIIVEDGWDVLVQNAFTGTFTGGIPTGLGGAFSHIGVGSGTDIPLSTDIKLAGPLSGCARELFIDIFSTGATSASLSTIDFTLAADFLGSTCGAASISEAGVFNDLTAGEMFARNTFTTIPGLGSLDTLEIEWAFTFGDA